MMRRAWVAAVPAAVLFLLAPAAAAPRSAPHDLAGCFGHRGIQITGFIAYECLFQAPGDGGALYWSVNESDINWDKHPGAGLDWVEASTLHVATDTSPPNNRQAFWVGIAHNADFCTVISPGYGQQPTQCEIDGVTHTMTARQQASYNQFAAAMTAAGLPDCAWSMTVTADESKCDIDA